MDTYLKESIGISDVSFQCCPAGIVACPETMGPVSVGEEVVIGRIPDLIEVVHIFKVA